MYRQIDDDPEIVAAEVWIWSRDGGVDTDSMIIIMMIIP
jgi:hypothetical protein